MRYMNANACPYRILIADGGRDKSIELHLRGATNYPLLSYEYVRYPFDADWPTFVAKQMSVCERAESEYVLLADNDDFYLVDRLPELIDFLDAHPDYSGCRGGLVQFSLLAADGSPTAGSTATGYRAARHEGVSIEGESTVERVESYFNGLVKYYHQMIWYSVLRREEFCATLRRVYRREYPDVVLNEMLVLLSVLKEGKVKVMDFPFYIRQSGSSQSEADLLKTNNLLEMLLANDVFHQLNEFLTEEKFSTGQEERLRMVRAVANYVGTWSAMCSDRYRHAGLSDRVAARARRIVTGNRHLFSIAHWAGLRFSHVLRGTRRITPLRLSAIEPFIIDSD